MKAITILLFTLFTVTALAQKGSEGNTRYILIEASCKPGFNALPEYKEKTILTKVMKKEFENAFEVVNAEPELIVAFEVALDKKFPNSRNKIDDILVYMLTSEQEAKELYQRKIKQFKTLNTGLIELKIK